MAPKPQYVHDLITSVRLLEDRVENLELDTENIETETGTLKDALEPLRRDVALINQQLAELTKRTEEWERRWWGIVTIMIGALLSLAAGLIVTLVRK
jgi:uncharacterized coiled-coil protein SlyX